MTRHDLVDDLRALMSDSEHVGPAIRVISSDPDRGLTIEAEGRRFDITISTTIETEAHELPQQAWDDALLAFAASIDEAEEDAERNGPVPADELRRALDEAKARGVKRWRMEPFAKSE